MRGEYIPGIPRSDLSDLLCDFKMGARARWYQFKSDQSHFIFEIFDFFGGFSKEAHSFQQLLCVGSLFGRLAALHWKDPVANSFGGTDHQHFLYRTAVRNGRSYPAKRRRTSGFDRGVFRPWTWADLSVEGRRELDMLMIRWFIDWCLSNQYMPGTQRFFWHDTSNLAIFFKTPNVMIKHWDMLFLPNYARSWVVLVCVMCQLRLMRKSAMMRYCGVWLHKTCSLCRESLLDVPWTIRSSFLLGTFSTKSLSHLLHPTSFTSWTLRPAGSLGTRWGASIRPGNLGDAAENGGRVSGCLAIYTWYTWITWFTFIEKIHGHWCDLWAQGSPRNDRYKAPRFWYPHTTLIVKNEVKTSYNRVLVWRGLYMFTFHNISRSFYFIQEMRVQINMKNVTANIIISQRHVCFTIKTPLTFNLFIYIYTNGSFSRQPS